jgi:hypothetical protein
MHYIHDVIDPADLPGLAHGRHQPTPANQLANEILNYW